MLEPELLHVDELGAFELVGHSDEALVPVEAVLLLQFLRVLLGLGVHHFVQRVQFRHFAFVELVQKEFSSFKRRQSPKVLHKLIFQAALFEVRAQFPEFFVRLLDELGFLVDAALVNLTAGADFASNLSNELGL
jgi:hypothetical protein